MKVRTNVKAGALTKNHSERATVKVRTGLKAGALTKNHSQNAR